MSSKWVSRTRELGRICLGTQDKVLVLDISGASNRITHASSVATAFLPTPGYPLIRMMAASGMLGNCVFPGRGWDVQNGRGLEVGSESSVDDIICLKSILMVVKVSKVCSSDPPISGSSPAHPGLVLYRPVPYALSGPKPSFGHTKKQRSDPRRVLSARSKGPILGSRRIALDSVVMPN